MNHIISNKEHAKNVFQEILNGMSRGHIYHLSWEEKKRAKTLKQLNFFWGAIIRSLENYFNELGYNYPEEVLKELLYCDATEPEKYFMPDGSTFISYPHLSRMTKEEASEFIQNCINWVDDNTECILPIGIRYLWTSTITDKEIDDLMNMPVPERDDLYLRHIRKQRCLYCGKQANHAHHIRTGFTGKGIKPSDSMAIPLCAEHHQLVHQIGEADFIQDLQQVLNGMDIQVFCRCLYQRTKLHL